jgi:microsomal dipeptidase-like Zn-dependent dipeptidase
MRPCRAIWLVALAAVLCAPSASFGAPAKQENARYALANGCYVWRSQLAGGLIVKDAGGYAATAQSPGQAEGFRMQATGLGKYLFYGRAGDFMSTSATDAVETGLTPSSSADWQVDNAGARSFRITLPAAGNKVLAVGDGGRLVLAEAGRRGPNTIFSAERAGDCATFPEVQTNAVGTPGKGPTPYGETRGFLEAHMHMMAFEFLGGRAHCAKPWDAFGAPAALVDCPDHYPNGSGAALENQVSYDNPARMHDPVGWPTFKDWPAAESLTHELSYYKWVERAWRGGLRTYVNLFVENRVLCEAYPLKKNSCNEMDAVRLQAKRIYELQDYIDAQHGGPGRGWFRIVKSPYQARRVINSGKLAVVLGIEVSEPFGCRVINDQPQCTTEDIDKGLDEVYKLGVRQMELINKFDNALGGVAGDTGSTGAVVNQGNKASTGSYWQMEKCTGPEGANDREQPTPFDHNTDELLANGLRELIPAGILPLYGPGPHCNKKGLTALGEHMLNRMMEKGMVVDPDHLSVLARNQALSVLEAKRYSGVVSSHSWSTVDAFPRIYKLGGVIAPYAGSSEGFVKKWQALQEMRSSSNVFWGVGYGADMNGLGSQGGPRTDAPNPVRYPFKSFDGKVTLDRQHSGERVFDINEDGVANYGLYPDWIEDLRQIAGKPIVDDMARGSEAYLQMWERAVGVQSSAVCQPARMRFSGYGLGRIDVAATPKRVLERAGQPVHRVGRTWVWCVRGEEKRTVKAALEPGKGRLGLVGSRVPGHRARGARPGGSARGSGIQIRRTRNGGAVVHRVRGGKVVWVAAARKSVAKKPAKLRRFLRLAGLR